MLYLQDPIHLKSFTSHPVLVVNPISAFAFAEGSASHAGSIAPASSRACLVATTMNRVVQATEASSRVFHSGCQALVLSFCQPHLLKSGTSCCDDKDYLLTYLCPSTRWEHGPSIKALHRILRCAMVAISCQVYPIFLASDFTSRRQVSSFPLPLGVPRQGLSCDASCRFSQRVTNPTPFSSFYFYFYWQ